MAKNSHTFIGTSIFGQFATMGKSRQQDEKKSIAEKTHHYCCRDDFPHIIQMLDHQSFDLFQWHTIWPHKDFGIILPGVISHLVLR